MIFGTRQDQHPDFTLGGHKIDICTDFKYLGVILAEIGTSTKQAKIMLSKYTNLNKCCNCLQLYLFDHHLFDHHIFPADLYTFL